MKRYTFIIVSCIVVTGNLFSQNWSPDQLLKLKNITSVQISPNGDKVLFTLREAIMTEDRSEYINQIWMVNADGSNAIQLSHTDKNTSNPKWSPDGTSYAFISNRDGKSNLYSISFFGGEAQKLTDVKSGITDFKWSPDGKTIAYIMLDQVNDLEEKSKKSKDDWYYMDQVIKQNKLYILNLNKADTQKNYSQSAISKDNTNINSFDWSPDSKSIVYCHSKSPEVNDVINSDISLVDVTTRMIKPIASTLEGESDPVFSPDGKSIVYQSTTANVDWAGPKIVKVYSMTDAQTKSLKPTPNADGNLLGWSADSKSIFWAEANKTLNSIYKLSSDGNSLTEFTSMNKDLITLPLINSTNTKIGFLLQNTGKFPEAYVSSLEAFNPVRITNINADNNNKILPKTEVLKWKGADGREIEGLLTYPLHYKPGDKVPLILNIHGGPAGVFVQSCIAANQGTYPIACLAEQGYAILRPNPRGSTGYGSEFRMANRADWGGKDYEDLMKGVDHVIKIGVADSNRMAVMGWSYGGFMSSWVVGHTNRFKVASIGAPVVDLVHQNLTDDIEGFLPSYFKSDPWNNWNLYDQHSPLRFVQNVKTPVMLQHGEADQRVPFSNAVMYYNALRRRNVPVKLLALPRQPHGPSEPRMVLKTMQSNVEWINQYIGEKSKS